MAVVIQVTETTRLPYVNLTPIKLVYFTGTMPTVAQTVYNGEFFMTAAWFHNSNGAGAKLTICEADSSNYLMQEYTLKADEFKEIINGPAGTLLSRKFYTGLKLLSNKENVHFQIRGFVRDV